MSIQDLEPVILSLKQKYNDLFYISHEGFDFVFRPLTHRESIDTSFFEGSPVELNDFIFKNTVLYCSNGTEWMLNFSLAGIVDSIVDWVMACSQFGDEKAFEAGLIASREKAQSVETLIEIYLCSAFRTLTPKDVRNMTFYEQMDYLAIAEAMLGKKIPLESDAPKRGKRQLSEQTSRILSKHVADKPDFEKDNRALRDLDKP